MADKIALTVNDQAIAADAGQSLFDCAESVGVRVPTSCKKNGKCRECIVEVSEGMQLLSPRTTEEEHLQGDFRLACRTQLLEGTGSVRCHTMRRGELVVATEGKSLDHVLVEVPLDPAVTRDGDTVLLDGEPIATSTGPLFGLAIDIGTTTVVLRMVDLESGSCVESQSFENPQRFGGSDVMARICYDGEHKGKILQRTLLAYLSHAIEALDCCGDDIYEVVIAANSTMRDLVFGLDVQSIGQRPYQSLTEKEWQQGKRQSTVLESTGKRMRLPIHPAARVYGMPLVRGHVGADAAACILAIDMPREDRLVVLMDIGTNTELLVGNRHKLLAASCPAGPAFEGGAISCGMAGMPGAIEGVTIDDDGKLSLDVIGGEAPAGICGSGLIDALGELLRTGRMDRYGRFTNDDDRFDLDTAAGLFVSEADISELAQAKGANMAGLRVVLNQLDVDIDDIDHFYLAGGFAQYLSVAAAKRIGLVPDLPDDRIEQIGNAAIEGATIALRSASRRKVLEKVVKDVVHVELETDEAFFDHFVEGCQFIPVTSVARFSS